MEFVVALFQNLEQHKDWTTTQAATEAYNVTLKPYHGWIAQTAFSVSLVPRIPKMLSRWSQGRSIICSPLWIEIGLELWFRGDPKCAFELNLGGSFLQTAMRFIPNRESFFANLGTGDLTGDIDRFIADFSPLLAENHEFLVSCGETSFKFDSSNEKNCPFLRTLQNLNITLRKKVVSLNTWSVDSSILFIRNRVIHVFHRGRVVHAAS
jgi:hypothetical protein